MCIIHTLRIAVENEQSYIGTDFSASSANLSLWIS